jgi:NAD(P)H dehydrogenase (quinone)
MPTYAVTGASGHLGRLAVGELLARGVPASDVVAVVRSRGNAADLAERGVHVREADYSDPGALAAALAGVERLLLVSSSVAGQRVAHHTNVIEAAKTVGTSRIAYTSMLNADDSTNPLAAEHRDTERALRDAGVAFTLLRNGWYTENYTEQLAQYLQRGEIVGAAGSGRISAATRQDYAAAAAAALLEDQEGNPTYELGGSAFDLPELARVISEVTGTQVTYRDLPVEEYTSWLQEGGIDEASAHFVAALDASIAHGDLETDSGDLARLLGRPATPIADAVRAARGGDVGGVGTALTTVGLIGAGNIGSALARLAVDAGYDVVLSNSRGPETLSDLVEQLGPHTRAATSAEAAAAGDLVVVTVPLKAYRDIPVEPLAGKVVIDTNNYYPDRDGHIAELDDESTTTSELLQAHLATSRVVKAFNTIFFGHLATLRSPHGGADRSAVPIAGDDEAAKKSVAVFLDAIGYDAYDVGPLREGWRYQRETTPYPYSTDGSFEHPGPADTKRVASLLAQAKRYRDM